MNPTIAMLTLLLALAVVATPAQAIDRQDVCDLPGGCSLPVCDYVMIGLLPPGADIDENCFDILPPPSGQGQAANETAPEAPA